LGNNQGIFQLHRFIRRENTAKSFRGLLFLLTLYICFVFCSFLNCLFLAK